MLRDEQTPSVWILNTVLFMRLGCAILSLFLCAVPVLHTEFSF